MSGEGLWERIPKGSVPLALYTFAGLSLLEITVVRVLFSLAGALVFLFWCLPVDESDENSQSWLWSSATSKAVRTLITLASSVIGSFAYQRWVNSAKELDTLALIAGFLFSIMIAGAVYLRVHLTEPRVSAVNADAVEVLKLEHQSCLTLLQTMLTAMAVLFIVPFLSLALGNAGPPGGVGWGKLAWSFYCLGGGIVLLTCPCADRAKQVRAELRRQAMRHCGCRDSDSVIHVNPELVLFLRYGGALRVVRRKGY